MEFKCLIQILKEKGYIEVNKYKQSLEIKTKFPIVRNKIENSLPEYAECELSGGGTTITIMTVEDLESWFFKLLNNEISTRVDLRRYFTVPERRIIDKIYVHPTKERDLQIKIKPVKYTDDYIITNIAKEVAKKAREKQKEQEVEDFINSLP